jgi:hypothetical protein
MDYLSAGLPCVLGRGDETAAEFEAAGFATLLDHREPELLASTLLALADDPSSLASAAAAGHGLAAARRWSAVGKTLRAAVASIPGEQTTAPRTRLALIGGTGSYYARKLAGRLATSIQ